MEEFVLTFGQRYAREAHPTLPDAHPDGYYLVQARDEDAARHLVYAAIGTAWSNLYVKDYFDADRDFDHYPRGVLGIMTAVAVPGDGTKEAFWASFLNVLLNEQNEDGHPLLQEILTRNQLLTARLTKALLPVPLGHHSE